MAGRWVQSGAGTGTIRIQLLVDGNPKAAVQVQSGTMTPQIIAKGHPLITPV